MADDVVLVVIESSPLSKDLKNVHVYGPFELYSDAQVYWLDCVKPLYRGTTLRIDWLVRQVEEVLQ